MKFIITPIIPLRPLQLPIIPNQSRRLTARIRNAPACTIPTTAHRRASEFDADGARAGDGVVRSFVEPDEVGDPVGVGVAGEECGVGDLLGVEVVEGAVAVGLVALCYTPSSTTSSIPTSWTR
jgi:hypothetical protein